jgi:hypothetical protein
MTTKAAAPAAEAPVAASVARKPFAIKIGAPAHAAFNEAVIHARNGFIFSDGPIEMMANGWAFFEMHQGNPVEHIVQSAKESLEQSARQEAVQYKKDVEEAAKRQLEQQQREALTKQVAAIKAEQARQIAALEKAAAEAIAAL